MPASLLTHDERELAFSIFHSSWNRALVFLGPDAKDKAHARVLRSFDEWSPEWRTELEFAGDTTTPKGRSKAIKALREADWLQEWEFQDARIAGEDE